MGQDRGAGGLLYVIGMNVFVQESARVKVFISVIPAFPHRTWRSVNCQSHNTKLNTRGYEEYINLGEVK
jgi:hypothetical protein